MTTDNWQQFKDIFQATLELPPDERSAYLNRVCPESASRAELEALLLCYAPPAGNTKEAIIHGLIESHKDTEPTHHDSLIDSFMDHYQIVEKLGERAFATQYLAVCLNDPALKQIVITIVNTTTPAADFLRSFKKERAILMNLRHPSIASFLNTGTTPTGLPYLATEYVQGTPIDEYCDSNRLNTLARINLFLNVCDSVQFAHQHFIAHSDITSRNILVTSGGVPKLLDLALADILNQKRPTPTEATADTQRGDMEYMSPEQVRGEPVTTGDDLYSLGVLLYRLLTGHSPYWVKAGTEGALVPFIFEAIRPSKVIYHISEQIDRVGNKITVNPAYLSNRSGERVGTIRKFLAGDLDSIMLKAIRKDGSRRYATVEQLSRDLRRYLDGRTVSARRATFLYRASRLMKRRKI